MSEKLKVLDPNTIELDNKDFDLQSDEKDQSNPELDDLKLKKEEGEEDK